MQVGRAATYLVCCCRARGAGRRPNQRPPSLPSASSTRVAGCSSFFTHRLEDVSTRRGDWRFANASVEDSTLSCKPLPPITESTFRLLNSTVFRCRDVFQFLTEVTTRVPSARAGFNWLRLCSRRAGVGLPREEVSNCCETRKGKRIAPQIQRTRSEDLLASVFPQAAACFENIEGDIQIPDHPLVPRGDERRVAGGHGPRRAVGHYPRD